MRTLSLAVAAALQFLPAVSRAQQDGASLPSIAPVEMTPAGTPGVATGQRTVRRTGTVYRIDLPTRIVVLRNEYGGYETIKVGPEVTGLEKFTPGDGVVVEMTQGLALEFQPPGSEFVPPTQSSAVDARPSRTDAVATASGDMRATVTLTAVDAKRRMVTFQGPGGNVYRVKAGPKVKLDRLKPGDRFLATYTESIALKLERPPPP
jgi:hypothetical protein